MGESSTQIYYLMFTFVLIGYSNDISRNIICALISGLGFRFFFHRALNLFVSFVGYWVMIFKLLVNTFYTKIFVLISNGRRDASCKIHLTIVCFL